MTYMQKNALFFLVIGAFWVPMYSEMINPLVGLSAFGVLLIFLIWALERHKKRNKIIMDERDKDNCKKADSIGYKVFFLYTIISFPPLGIIYNDQAVPMKTIGAFFMVGVGVMIMWRSVALLCIYYLQTEKGARFSEKYLKYFVPKENR
jgi:hypothetical protein